MQNNPSIGFRVLEMSTGTGGRTNLIPSACSRKKNLLQQIDVTSMAALYVTLAAARQLTSYRGQQPAFRKKNTYINACRHMHADIYRTYAQ